MKHIMIVEILTLAVLLAKGQEKTIQYPMESKALKQFSLLVSVPINYSPEQVKAAGVIWNQRL